MDSVNLKTAISAEQSEVPQLLILNALVRCSALSVNIEPLGPNLKTAVEAFWC